MTEPITRLGKQEKFLRTIRKMLEATYGTGDYTLDINISGGTTKINIVISDLRPSVIQRGD